MFEIVMGIDDFLIQLVKYWKRRAIFLTYSTMQEIHLQRNMKLKIQMEVKRSTDIQVF